MIDASVITLLALIVQDRTVKQAQSPLEFNEFMEWLDKVKHSETKQFLELKTEMAIQMKALLNQDHALFNENLVRLNAAVIAFSCTIEGLDELAFTFNSDVALSPQAISILHQFEKSGAKKVLELRMALANEYIFLEKNGSLEINEPRYIETDMQALVEHGMLKREYNTKGDNIFILTKLASNLIRK